MFSVCVSVSATLFVSVRVFECVCQSLSQSVPQSVPPYESQCVCLCVSAQAVGEAQALQWASLLAGDELEGQRVMQIVSGNQRTACLTADGTLWGPCDQEQQVNAHWQTS